MAAKHEPSITKHDTHHHKAKKDRTGLASMTGTFIGIENSKPKMLGPTPDSKGTHIEHLHGLAEGCTVERNGTASALADLHAGDSVTVWYKEGDSETKLVDIEATG